MKPQDLRIGNYVRIKASGQTVQVCAINEIEVGVYYKSASVRYLVRYRYHDIEPVPIREVYDKMPYIERFYWSDTTDTSNIYYYKDIPLTYLHHLQNIHYVFTGNEIEIEI